MTYKIEDWDQTKYLPPQTNSTPELEIVRSLKAAWVNVLKTEPSINSLAVLFSQITLECGPNLKYCKNSNVGNIKSLPNDGRNWTAFRCNEIINGVNQYYDPPNPICNFRAFKTADEGFIDYIQFLAQKKNYANAWAQVIIGDPAEYVHQLKLSKYFTASEQSYLAGVVSIFNAFIKKYGSVDLDTHTNPPNDMPIQPIFTPEELAQIQGNVALTMSKSIDEYFISSRTPGSEESDDVDFDGLNDVNAPIPMPQSVWSSLTNIFKGKK